MSFAKQKLRKHQHQEVKMHVFHSKLKYVFSMYINAFTKTGIKLFVTIWSKQQQNQRNAVSSVQLKSSWSAGKLPWRMTALTTPTLLHTQSGFLPLYRWKSPSFRISIPSSAPPPRRWLGFGWSILFSNDTKWGSSDMNETSRLKTFLMSSALIAGVLG